MTSVWWLDGHNERATWADTAVARLEELVLYGGHKRKEIWTTYLSHAIHVAGLDGTVDETARASLLDRVGRCQTSLGQYSAAETTHRQVLSLREKRLGKEHNQTLISMNEVGVALDNQGRYEAAEAMNKQTLAWSEKVLGPEHPDTLTSVYCLAHLLANRHCYNESLVLYERACAAYSTVLGKDHPTTRACRQHYSEILALQEQDRFALSPKISDSSVSIPTGKGSKLSRGLAKMGINCYDEKH